MIKIEKLTKEDMDFVDKLMNQEEYNECLCCGTRILNTCIVCANCEIG